MSAGAHPLVLLTSTKGKPMIGKDGHLFQFDHYGSEKKMWRCVHWEIKKCKARLHTTPSDTPQLIREVGAHNHEPRNANYEGRVSKFLNEDVHNETQDFYSSNDQDQQFVLSVHNIVKPEPVDPPDQITPQELVVHGLQFQLNEKKVPADQNYARMSVRPMTYEEKGNLQLEILELQEKNVKHFNGIVELIQKAESNLQVDDWNQFDIDLDDLSDSTLRKLEVYVAMGLKKKRPKLSFRNSYIPEYKLA